MHKFIPIIFSLKLLYLIRDLRTAKFYRYYFGTIFALEKPKYLVILQYLTP